jgi:ribosome-associated protein YbcJ (S4-like RNA binding protein)
MSFRINMTLHIVGVAAQLAAMLMKIYGLDGNRGAARMYVMEDNGVIVNEWEEERRNHRSG